MEEKGLHCEYCDYVKALTSNADEVVEHPLHLEGEMMRKGEELEIDVKVFHCQSCGSETSHPEDQVKLTSAFCGSEHVNETATETSVIKRTGLIPIKVT